MKKRLIPIALVMGAISANAQVGIGTATPNKSAELTVHAKDGDRGVLIPSVSLSDTKDKGTIKSGNVNSLLVFNINTAQDVTPGYYYWYIDKWERLTTANDIPAIVVNNFENILNMEGDKVTNLIKNIVRNTEGNVIYEGDKLYYINADGDKVEINFGDIVAENESKTVIVSNTSKKQQYYISESYLQVNDTPTQATIDAWTAGTIPAGVYAIDVVGGVVNNFEEIVNNGPINVDGRTFPTINDYITYLTESTGGFTKIVYDPTTGDAIFQEWNEATNSWVNVNNAKFKKIVTDNESKTVIVSNTLKKQQYYISEAYLQANQLPTQATIDAWTAGTVPAGVYAIDVVGGVINNFQEFVNHGPITVDGRTYPTVNDYITYLTESTGGFTKIVYDSQNRNASFQQWDEATGGWVNVINSKFKKIITDNESQTQIITVNGKQYYVSEAYLAANDGVVPTTVDPTNLPAGIYAIDVVGGVVNNFEEIVKNGPITVDGRTYPTINDYITYLTETTGGFTKIVYDQTTGDAIFQEWDASTNSWVNVDNSKFQTIVTENETVTVLVKNTNGTFTYYNENEIDANGQPKAGATGVTIDPALVIVEDKSKSEGKYIFKDSEGNEIATIDINSDNILYDNTDSGLTSTNVKDALDELANTIATSKGDLTIAGGLEFTGGTDGAAKLLADAGIQIADGGVSTDKIADKAVTSAKLDGGQGVDGRVGVAGADGTITYKTLDEVVKANETVTVLIENTNGTFTYYNESEIDENGQPKAGATGVTIDPKEVSVALNPTTNIYEFKNSNGDVIGEIDANANAITFDDSTTNLNVTNVQGAIEKLLEKITTIEGTTGDLTIAGGLEFTGGTDGAAKLLADAGIQIADGGVSTDKIADKAVTSAKLDGGQGVDGRVGVAGADGTITYKTLDEVVKANETVTVLVKNTNGTFTYYNENEIDANGQPKAGAIGVTIDPALVIVEDKSKSEGKYIFKDSEGNEIATIDINSDNILYDNTDSGLTSTNVKDALDELANTIATSKGDLTIAGGLEFTGGTDGAAKLLADAGIQIADGGVSTDKIADKAVTSAKLDGGQGVDGRVGVAGADGTITYKTLDEVVKANETVTVLIENTNGTFTYYNENEIDENGQPKAGATGVTIDPKEVSVALNPTTNIYEFKNSNGDVIGEIDANANAITFDDSTTNLNVTNVQGAIEKLLEKITTIEGTTGDLTIAGGLEFTGGTDGAAKLLADAGIQIADGGVSTDKIADKAVTSAKLDGGQGVDGRVGVAGADGTITYKTLDEVVKANETVTVLVKNTNGTFTYYNENEIDANGQPKAGATGVTIDPALVIVEDKSKSEGKYIFKDSEGNEIATIDINSDNILYDNTDSGLTSTNVKDALDELANTIATSKGDLTIAGGLEFTGGTDGAAKLLADAGIQIADGGVSTDKIADKAVTSAKLDGGQGVDGRVGVAGADGTITYKTLDEVVKANETVTVLIENTNGTFTYYNESEIDANGQPKAGATGVTIDPKEVSVALNPTTNIYEFKNSNGDVIGEIDANANAITFDDSTTNLNVTNVQGAIEKLLEKITTIEGTTGDLTVAGGLAFTGGTDGTAKLLADAGIEIADLGVTAAKLDGGKGLDGRVGVADADGNVTYELLDTVVKANETVTVLVKNGNGTFTYYNEKQIGTDGQPLSGATGVTIDPKEVSVALNPATNVYEFKNANGDVIGEIDANANAIAFGDINFTSTNVQDALVELLSKITAVEGTKGDLTSASIYVDGGADALLKDAKLDLKGGAKDGQVLVTVTKDVVIGKDSNGDDIIENRKVTEWQDPKEVVAATVTAKNGITVVNDAAGNSEFRLGGPLDAATVITTTGTNTLAIAGLDNVTTNPTANNLVIADASGVLKQTSAKNMIEDVITKGDLEAKKLKGVGITVTAGENAGTNLNTEVVSSLLKDVTLGIADKAVTAGKLDAGTSTSDAPRVGIADQDGNVTYQDLQTVVQAEQKTVVLEDGINTKVSSRVDAANPNETIWKVDVANAVKTVATATALAAADAVILVDADQAPTEGIVITLPTADANNKGKKYTIKKLDTNEDGYVVVAGNIGGLNGKKLETGLPYSGWDFVSDGTQWQIVNKF
ncbi:beta strand repeat-containing protein [Myroides fluvii]|uniref:beta strand repeat-containing protein n=1 Tax=Myroides fluvii TaxID=2572594 RepID=UPI00131CA180|nr:hypothetical protein [Myroides fluvii]